jgi:hypothetical protein
VLKRGFTLRLRPHLFKLGMPSTLANQITGGDEGRLQEPIDILEMSVSTDGFHFVTADDLGNSKWELKYEPAHFPRFLADLCAASMPPAAVFNLNTAGSCKILVLFFNWLNEQQAAVFEQDIESGKLTFEEARDIRPEVFDVPTFQRFHAQRFKVGNMPKGKKGKRVKYRPEVEALYALACRIYREDTALSWEDACYSATEARPDLVPQSWHSDPDGNLKREAARYWDKSPYSQLSYRQRRDG